MNETAVSKPTETETRPVLRDARGFFIRGTRPGPGLPKGSLKDKFFHALERELTPENMKEIAQKIVAMAKEGNLGAVEIFVPKPAQIQQAIVVHDRESDEPVSLTQDEIRRASETLEAG